MGYRENKHNNWACSHEVAGEEESSECLRSNQLHSLLDISFDLEHLQEDIKSGKTPEELCASIAFIKETLRSCQHRAFDAWYGVREPDPAENKTESENTDD